jgi:cytochrome c-type biogenesis protein CcmH/NrfF
VKRFAPILILLLVAAPAARGADPQDIANDISRQMLSPYCPGITLHDCPSDNSIALRSRITRWAERGMDKAAIERRLEADFGENIWASPETSGSGLWAWVLPIAAGVAGVALVGVLATRWARRPAPERTDGPDPTPEQRRRLDLELAALRDRQG